MRRRHLYALMYALPALLAAVIAAALLLAASAGALWLFVFGDDPWPRFAETLLTATFVGSGLTLWAALLAAAYAVGKAEESRPALNRAHVWLSVALTAGLAGLIAARVWGLGQLGPKPDTQVCADYCLAEGFAGSGMPPRDSGDRTCSCYDSQGQEARRINVTDLQP
jgi:hypothetical protein